MALDNNAYLRLLNHRLKENDDWYKQAAKLLGISDSTFWILYMLYDYPEGITQKTICAVSYFPKQTINSSLKKLEMDGIITLVPKKRSKNITLTTAGREFVSNSIVKVRKAEHAALNGMTDEEKEILISTLDRFTRLLNDATHIIKE